MAQSVFTKRGMMSIRRALAVAVIAAFAGASAPVVVAQQNNQQNRRDQERQSQQQQSDIQALVQVVDAVAEGKPAPAAISVTWEGNHFVKGADGSTYIPFILDVDASKLGSGAAVYVRAVSKDAAAAPAAEQNAGRGNDPGQQQARVIYPWDNVYFLNAPPDGRISRAMALKPGNYELFIAVKQQSPQEPPRNAPAAEVGMLRRDLTVPGFDGPGLSTSSILVASSIEGIAAPLSPQEQQENPYTFGTMRVVPSVDGRVRKSGELQVLFWIYGAQHSGGKPAVQIEYNFHQRLPEGEKYFNKTAPQVLNPSTLPPQFDVAAGHQLPGSLVVPLASFPEGQYRLEIKVTDKLSGTTLTENATFTVES